MRLPSTDLPWGADGVIQWDADRLYDAECRCGLVRRGTYVTHDGRRGPRVAVKVLDRTAVARAKDNWVSEVGVMSLLQPAGLRAARVCPQMTRWAHRAVADEPNVYIATEWADGGTLQSWALAHIRQLASTQQFDLWFQTVLPRLAHQLLNGLRHMHSAGPYGVAHLDLDPMNIVMSSPDLDAEMRFIDYGSSRPAASDGSVGDDGIKWKFYFCAPELYRFWAREIDIFHGPRADMFSAATILWWLVALPPAHLFGDTRPDRLVDRQKHWHRNLCDHADGRHAGEAERRAAANLATAKAQVSRVLAELHTHSAAVEQAAARVEGVRRRAAVLGPAVASTDRALTAAYQAAVADGQRAVQARAAAQSRLEAAHAHLHELHEGRRVTPEFAKGECLCCRWAYSVPSQWQTLLVEVLMKDRTPAAEAFEYLCREIRGIAPPPPAPQAEANTACSTVAGAGVGAGAGANAAAPATAGVGVLTSVNAPMSLVSGTTGGMGLSLSDAGDMTSLGLLKPDLTGPPVVLSGGMPSIGLLKPDHTGPPVVPASAGPYGSSLGLGPSFPPSGPDARDVPPMPRTASADSDFSAGPFPSPPHAACDDSLLGSSNGGRGESTAAAWYPDPAPVALPARPAAGATAGDLLGDDSSDAAADERMADAAFARRRVVVRRGSHRRNSRSGSDGGDSPMNPAGSSRPTYAAAPGGKKRSAVSPTIVSGQSLTGPRPARRMRSDTSLLADTVGRLGVDSGSA